MLFWPDGYLASYPGLLSQLFSQPWKKKAAKKAARGSRPGHKANG